MSLALKDRLAGTLQHLRASWDLLSKGEGVLVLPTVSGPYGAPASAWSWLGPTTDENLLKGYANSPWAHIKFLRLCSSVAMLDFVVKARIPGKEPASLSENYPLWTLLRDPNPVLTGWDFTFLSELYVRTTGEVYWRVERDGLAKPKALWIYPRQWIRPNRDKDRQVISYTLSVPKQEVPAKDMIWLHTPNPSDPYIQGLGDLLASATEIETFEYASEADKNFFLRDATPQMAVTMPGTPRKEERDQFREEWRRRHGSFKNYGEPAVLWGGMTIDKIRDSRKDMDFVDGQKWLRDTIIAGVHPHILGIAEGVNRAQAEAAEYTFARWEILPRAKWHAAVRNKYLAPQFDPRAFVEYVNVVPDDADRLLKAALDPITGEILTVDERLMMLSRAVGGIKPVGGTYGQSYITSVARAPLLAEREGGVSGQERPQGEPEEPPAPELPKSRNNANKFGMRRGFVVYDRLSEADVQKLKAPFIKTVKRITLRDILAVLGLEEAAETLWRALRPAYEAVMESRWEQATEEVGLGVGFDVTDPEVARFLREASGKRIRGIAGTQLEQLRETLAEGVGRGEGIPDLVQRVSTAFGDAKGRRAVIIARTETLEASNRAALIAYREAGVERHEWLLAPDYTPEIDNGECQPFDGKVVAVGEEFAPGVLYPPLHPACRCATAPIVGEEGEERRLYEGEERKRHITALGHTHERLERMFLASVKRGMQAWQNTVARHLRALGQEAA